MTVQKIRQGVCSSPLIVLTIAVVIGFIIVIALAIDLGSLVKQRNSLLQGAQPLCVDSNCLWEASEILNVMNQTGDPCEDFYDFACGNFANVNPIPDIFTEVTQITLLQQSNDAKLQEILNEPILDQSLASAEQNAKIFWASCQDTFTITARGGVPLLTAIQNIGGWVPLGNFESADFNTQLQNVFATYGAMPFVTLQAVGDDSSGGYSHPARENIIEILPANLGLNNMEYYLFNDSYTAHLVGAYGTYISTIIQNLWTDGNIKIPNAAQVLQQAVKDIMYVETVLANITFSNSHGIVPENNRYTIGYLDANYGTSIIWLSLLEAYFSSATVLNANYAVYIDQIGFISDLTHFIANTTARQLNTYMIWRLVDMYVSELGWNYLHAEADWLAIRDEDISVTDKDSQCFQQVQYFFGYELGRLFVLEQFASYGYTQMQGMKNILENIIQARVQTYGWMDAVTKANATAKLQNTVDKFGYPTWLLDGDQVNDYYANVDMENGQHFENMVNLRQFDIYLESISLNYPIDKNQWPENVFDVQYYYDPDWNEVFFPVGILQHPLFQPAIPQYVNFAAIGRLISQSLVQIIDPQGMHSDANGNYNDWWTAQTKANFVPIQDCHSNLYNNISILGYPLPAWIFAQEDWEVVAGVNIAYQAYKQYLASYGPENLLPGLHIYSVDQVFFISFAQTFCYNRNDLMALVEALTGFFAPENILLGRVLPQIPEFAAAFQCAKGTPMNDGKTCDGF